MLQRSSRIPTKKVNLLLKAFAVFDMTAVNAAEFAGTSRNTANLYYTHFREKIADYARRAPRFSGEIEMDQAQFGKGVRRGEKITRKSKPKTGHKLLVFGIMQRGGEVYTQIVPNAERKTLIPIIHMVVEPGSTVYTDMWLAFESLKKEGYTHFTVNHSKGPVALNGAHTGNIDAFWGFAKQHLARYRGLSRRTFPLHLKECELRYNMKDRTDSKKFFKFMQKLVAKNG
ncbi:MAG TPA: IS1595 family transposase [Candidatus Paceibacterota bacterium]